jgi:hypothetical protein
MDGFIKHLLKLEKNKGNLGESLSKIPHLSEEKEQDGGGPFGDNDSAVEKAIRRHGDPEEPHDHTQQDEPNQIFSKDGNFCHSSSYEAASTLRCNRNKKTLTFNSSAEYRILEAGNQNPTSSWPKMKI